MRRTVKPKPKPIEGQAATSEGSTGSICLIRSVSLVTGLSITSISEPAKRSDASAKDEDEEQEKYNASYEPGR